MTTPDPSRLGTMNLVGLTGDLVWRSEDAALLKRAGLSHRQFLTLYTIGSATDLVTAAEVARRLGRNDNTVGAIVHGLERQGLVDSFASPRDGRGAYLRLTESGKRILAAGRDVESDLAESLLSGLSDSEVDLLGRLLQKLKSRLAGSPPGK